MSTPRIILSKLKNRSKPTRSETRTRIRVGMATCGISAGADVVSEAFNKAVKEAGISNVTVIPTGCVGRCDLEPMAEVTIPGEPPVLYIKLDEQKVSRIVQEHLVGNKVVEEYVG